MKYYSSMTLADYVAANWMELPKELVELFEKESDRFFDQEDAICAWREAYQDARDAGDDLVREINKTCDAYATARMSSEDFLLEIRYLADEADFECA